MPGMCWRKAGDRKEREGYGGRRVIGRGARLKEGMSARTERIANPGVRGLQTIFGGESGLEAVNKEQAGCVSDEATRAAPMARQPSAFSASQQAGGGWVDDHLGRGPSGRAVAPTASSAPGWMRSWLSRPPPWRQI